MYFLQQYKARVHGINREANTRNLHTLQVFQNQNGGL
nr:MAG TPA: hypothetical protein [Caudoviricetes sp.]